MCLFYPNDCSYIWSSSGLVQHRLERFSQTSTPTSWRHNTKSLEDPLKYSHHLKISISFSDRTASAANMQSKLNKECLIRSVQKITNCSLESVQFSLDQKNQIWSSFALMKFYGKSLINNTFMFAARSEQSRLSFFSGDKGGQCNNITPPVCLNRQRRTLQMVVCMDGSWVIKLPCNPRPQGRSLQRWLFLGFGCGHIYAPSSPCHSGVFYRWSAYYILVTLWSIILSVLICQNDVKLRQHLAQGNCSWVTCNVKTICSHWINW